MRASRAPAARGKLGALAQAELSEPLLRSAYSLAVNGVVTAGLGMAFWIVAARLFPAEVVGRDSALIAAMVQLSMIAQLNMSNAIIRFMPGRLAAGRLLLGAYATSALAAILLGSGFVLLAPLVSDDFDFFAREPLTSVAYVISIVLWGVFTLQDAALTAMRQAPWVVVESGVFGVLKLIGLPLLFLMSAKHGVFIAWVVPVCLLLLPVNWLLFRRVLVAERSLVADEALHQSRRRLVGFLALDYLATVFIQTSLTILPLIVIGVLGSRATAFFYIPFTIAVALDALFSSLGSSVVAEGALAPERVGELVRLLGKRIGLLLMPVIGVLFVAAPLVLLPFGREYSRESTSILRILLLASVFRAAVLMAAAIWRIERRGARIATLEGVMLLGLVCAAIPLAHFFGVSGVAFAWLGSAVAAAAAASPVLLRYIRPQPRAS